MVRVSKSDLADRYAREELASIHGALKTLILLGVPAFVLEREKALIVEGFDSANSPALTSQLMDYHHLKSALGGFFDLERLINEENYNA
jgi:hypothetical protein